MSQPQHISKHIQQIRDPRLREKAERFAATAEQRREHAIRTGKINPRRALTGPEMRRLMYAFGFEADDFVSGTTPDGLRFFLHPRYCKI